MNDSEPRKFAFFPKLLKVSEHLETAEEKAAFFEAVGNYGCYGIEPEFDKGYMYAIFESVREDIDFSLDARYRNKGGRPKKAETDEIKPTLSKTEKPKTPVFKIKTPVRENETGDSDFCKNGENAKPITKHSNTVQSTVKEKEEKKKKNAFSPPSLEEVQAYIADKGSHVNAVQFWNYYESNGWKVGKNPMRSWHSAIATWEQREGVQDAKPNPFANVKPDVVVVA